MRKDELMLKSEFVHSKKENYEVEQEKMKYMFMFEEIQRKKEIEESDKKI
jgi:hypothetical protein